MHARPRRLFASALAAGGTASHALAFSGRTPGRGGVAAWFAAHTRRTARVQAASPDAGEGTVLVTNRVRDGSEREFVGPEREEDVRVCVRMRLELEADGVDEWMSR